MGGRQKERDKKAVMARTWTRRSFAGGLAAIAAVLLALALAATTRTNALEVTSSETYYVPVRLRGNLYLVSLTQTSFSYDERREEAEEERETFFPKVSTFDGDDGDLGIVTFFDDDGVSATGLLKEEEETEGGGGGGLAAASQKSGAGDASDEEDPIDFVEEEDVEEEQEEKDAFEESTDVDLYWLQQQIDLLAQFDSALSLDSVYNQAGPGRPCRHHRRGGRGGHFRHSHQRGGRRDGRAAAVETYNAESQRENFGFIVLSIVIICLYCVVIFGAIYVLMLLIQAAFKCISGCIFGTSGDDNSGGYILLEDDESDVEQAADGVETAKGTREANKLEEDDQRSNRQRMEDLDKHENPLLKWVQ